MVMYWTKLLIYLGEITRHIIVAWMFANGNKCCALVGLEVTEWYTLVIGHYKYIVSSCNGIIICLSPRAEKMWNVCKSNARW